MIPQSITVSYAATLLQLKMGDHRALGLVLSHFKNNASFHSNLQFADMDLEGLTSILNVFIAENLKFIPTKKYLKNMYQFGEKISSAQVKFSNKFMIKQFGFDE